MADQFIEFGILNVVAHPHETGVYRKLLTQAANREVNFWGDQNAAIRLPREIGSGVLQFEIVIGTEIDLDEPLIDRASLEEVSADEADVRVSMRHLYNGKVFLATFLENTHHLFFESKNEFGKRLSPNRAHRIFKRLFSQETLGADAPYVDVTVVPEDDTLDRLLGVHRLDRVEIFLRRQNPADATDPETQEVLDDLFAQGAKSQDVSLARAPEAPRIVLNAKNFVLAKVAQLNGYVRASGMEEDGNKISGSTKEYPKVIKAAIDGTTAITTLALRIAKQTRVGERQAPNGD